MIIVTTGIRRPVLKIITGKRTLLLDDIITRGDGFRQTAEKLMDSGAASVTGLFLAQTVLNGNLLH